MKNKDGDKVMRFMMSQNMKINIIVLQDLASDANNTTHKRVGESQVEKYLTAHVDASYSVLP